MVHKTALDVQQELPKVIEASCGKEFTVDIGECWAAEKAEVHLHEVVHAIGYCSLGAEPRSTKIGSVFDPTICFSA